MLLNLSFQMQASPFNYPPLGRLRADGVLCCNRNGMLEEDKLHRLQSVVHRTGARVVLSTDWRRDAMLKQRLVKVLRMHGIEVIGATFKGPPLQPVRPREISAWLEGYESERRLHASLPVSAWVAVDDRMLLREQGAQAARPAIHAVQPRKDRAYGGRVCPASHIALHGRRW